MYTKALISLFFIAAQCAALRLSSGEAMLQPQKVAAPKIAPPTGERPKPEGDELEREGPALEQLGNNLADLSKDAEDVKILIDALKQSTDKAHKSRVEFEAAAEDLIKKEGEKKKADSEIDKLEKQELKVLQKKHPAKKPPTPSTAVRPLIGTLAVMSALAIGQ